MRKGKRLCCKSATVLAKSAKNNPSFSGTIGEKVEDVFSNDDIAIKILSRLPIDCINKLKCVCKRWFEILSHPFFRAAHFQISPRNLSGLFVQGTHFCNVCCSRSLDFKEVNYISFGKDGQIMTKTNILDFLPEKVVVIASCNGILLCRSLFESFDLDHYLGFPKVRRVSCVVTKEIVLYVCNPFTKEWISFKPEGKYYSDCCYGFVCDSSGIINFEVIMICCPLKRGTEPYLFTTYSSKTGAWRLSKDICYLADRIYLHHSWHADGVFYWYTTNHSILAFNLKEDSSQVINLPGVALFFEYEGVCLGVSEGKLHYICFNLVELMIWILEYDTMKPKWSLKHSMPIVEMDKRIKFSTHPPDYEKHPNNSYTPYGLHGDLLFLWMYPDAIVAYNIKTGKVEKDICSFDQLQGPRSSVKMMIPYSECILQVPLAKNEQEVTS